MKRNSLTKHILTLLSKVLVMCTLVVASLHFILSVYVAFRTQHVFYLNPIRITALNDLWPTYANSDMATLIGWLLLTALYLSVLVTYIRKYDPELIGRIRNSIEYNRETRRVTYETRNAKEIELIPITKLLVQFYKLKSRFGESEII